MPDSRRQWKGKKGGKSERGSGYLYKDDVFLNALSNHPPSPYNATFLFATKASRWPFNHSRQHHNHNHHQQG